MFLKQSNNSLENLNFLKIIIEEPQITLSPEALFIIKLFSQEF